jgi:uncharacterized RDD family membrane protein YckC
MENRVGFGPRLLALLIDYAGIIMLATLFFIFLPQIVQPLVDAQLAEMSEEQMAQIPFDITNMIMFLTIMYFARILYFSSEIAVGTSLGKYLLKLNIACIDGSQPTTGKLALRFAIKHIYPLITILSMVLAIKWIGSVGFFIGLAVFGGCFAAAGEKKQSLQDLAAQTIVIRTNTPKTEETNSNWISENEAVK